MASTSQPASVTLTALAPGQLVPFSGDRAAVVGDDLAAAFRSGDRLVVVHETGDLLHIPADQHAIVDAAVGRAVDAFHRLAEVDDDAITTFFDTACSSSDGSCSTAAERNASAGTNITTNSGAGANWSQ